MKRLFALTTILSIAIMSIGVAGCASHNDSMASTSWHLQSYGLASQQKTLLSSSAITLVFDENASHISGNAGINLYGGDCVIHDSGITISQIYQTQLGQPDSPVVIQQENDYLTLLAAAARFQASDNSLSIYCRGDQVLVFTREGAESSATLLAGTSWHLVSYRSGFWQMPLIPFTKITLVFDMNAGVVRGNAGCNFYGADFTIASNSLTISRLTQTLMKTFLPPGVMQQERYYLELLEKSDRLTLSGRNLTIYCTGNEQLRFRRD